MKPELSIIIITWNTDKITLSCVQTINKFLRNKIKYEIIVVDNASTDQTQKLLKPIKNLHYIKNKTNLGFSKANNIGAKIAKGDYLLFLNSDMKLIDDSLLAMLTFYKQNKHIGIIGPKFLNPDHTPQGSILPPQTIKNAFKQFFLNQPAYLKYYSTSPKPIPVWAISGGAMLIENNFFKQLGGWDEKYFFYYEDLELCRQTRRQNKLVYYFPTCKVIHHHGASGKKITDSANQWRRLIKSSKLYHGLVKHYLINFVIWSSQKIHALKK